jgi:hypothetical protein
MYRITAIICLLTAVVFAGCGDSEDRKRLEEAGKKLVGEWNSDEHSWNFRPDGKYDHEEIYSRSSIDRIYSEEKGTWKVENIIDGTLEVRLVSNGSSWTVFITISGDQMRMKYFNSDDVFDLKRVLPEKKP